MHLLELPNEVIDDKVLKYLDWNDLLRFRRVCKRTKEITHGYLLINADQAPEIEINDQNKSLDAFVAMGIPTAKLFLNNQSGYSFYEQITEETVHQFFEEYGRYIKHLRVNQITFVPFGRELNFINRLKNLKSFEGGYFGYGKKNEDEWSAAATAILSKALENKFDNCLETRLLPSNFKYLESIKIGQDAEFVKTIDIVSRSECIFDACPQLKYACHSFDSTFKTPEYWEGLTQDNILQCALPRAFFQLFLYIKERPNEQWKSNIKQRLEVFDFQNYHHENVPWTVEMMESLRESHRKLQVCWVASMMFMEVCLRALESGLKLMNVNPSWYCARFSAARFRSLELGFPLVSLVGLDPCLGNLDMPNLEKITIKFTSGCVTGDEGRPEWPALKSVDITVDGKVGIAWNTYRKERVQDVTETVGQNTRMLFRYLFGNGMVSANMVELSISFVEGKGKEELSVPKTEVIVKGCPNLKRISLGNWMGTNKQLVELWEGLKGLEEISLENCQNLGNVAFVGENVGNPVFLGLINLKKLYLKGLDKMPKITDTLFCLVMSQMKLKELVLTSDEPLEKVTKKGIQALLAGPFSETIERFSFRNWSTADMTQEEFQELGKKFRSYAMI